ncbi:MAG: carbohydrate ABC transporter permease [Thermomicrobiales bacterium]|jgi:multiple sugar transport system permease protein|nr:sugar ABC transporter permease [Thermomicrobiales bacterium]
MRTGQLAARPDVLGNQGGARRRGFFNQTIFAYLLNVPALIIIAMLIAYPVGYSFWLSLQKYNLKRPDLRRFIWFDNYRQLLTDSTFLNSIKVSCIFSLCSVILVVILSVALALLLNESFFGRGIMRSLILLPWAIPGVVNGLMWKWVFNARVGVLNGFLYDVGLIHQYHTWLIDPNIALAFAIFANVWNVLPFSVIILLAGLSTIPSELYDAAKVDRAGVVQRFRNVTLPWLLHPLLIVLILQTMNAFRTFDTIYILTGGGPGEATNVIALQTVRTVLDFTDFGKGNAYAYVITLITLVIAIFYVSTLYKRGSFEV